MAQAGFTAPDNSGNQRAGGVPIPWDQGQPGDNVGFPGHVAIYLATIDGQRYILEASWVGTPIHVVPIQPTRLRPTSSPLLDSFELGVKRPPVGMAAMATGLQSAAVIESIVVLRALVEHRDDVVVKTRTQTISRLHVLIRLIPSGAPRNLDADTAAQLLRPIHLRNNAFRALRRWPGELVAEVRHLDRRIATANTHITEAMETAGSTLTELRGFGNPDCHEILARVGVVKRFRSAAAFASYPGTAPIEVSSGHVVRHRLSRAGDRQLNHCLHIMAITQIRMTGPR